MHKTLPDFKKHKLWGVTQKVSFFLERKLPIYYVKCHVKKKYRMIWGTQSRTRYRRVISRGGNIIFQYVNKCNLLNEWKEKGDTRGQEKHDM